MQKVGAWMVPPTALQQSRTIFWLDCKRAALPRDCRSKGSWPVCLRHVTPALSRMCPLRAPMDDRLLGSFYRSLFRVLSPWFQTLCLLNKGCQQGVLLFFMFCFHSCVLIYPLQINMNPRKKNHWVVEETGLPPGDFQGPC